jgi:hypothetical protein
MEMVEGFIDGRLRPAERRSPFYGLPIFRTNFFRGVGVTGVAAAVALSAWLIRRTRR